MRKRALWLLVSMLFVGLVGCTEDVAPGKAGRVKTSSGWANDILKTGRHSCYGRDQMYLVDATSRTFKEKMNILVGGKVNLTVDFAVRVRANIDDPEQLKRVFESVTAVNYEVTVEQLYNTFLQMKAQAVPRQLYEAQPDIQTALANSSQLAAEIRSKMTEAAKATPLLVEDAQITNYDWPASLTKAQEELAGFQLKEAAATAQVRADLKAAEGKLKVEEANKLVEMKKAEAIAESIRIVKGELSGTGGAEYLLWHQIRVMGEVANGPNNSFILYPYGTDATQVRSMVNNANLSQMLEANKAKMLTTVAAPKLAEKK